VLKSTSLSGCFAGELVAAKIDLHQRDAFGRAYRVGASYLKPRQIEDSKRFLEGESRIGGKRRQLGWGFIQNA
jgi:hypothetical protein